MIKTAKNKGCEKEEYIPGHRQREIPDRLRGLCRKAGTEGSF